jgi:hypothetical protein
MNWKELYEYIKPLIDIYFIKYFGEKKDFMFEMTNIIAEKAEKDATGSTIPKCEFMIKIYYYVIFIIFISLIIWILYDTLIKNYRALSYSIGSMVKEQIKLKDMLEFKQIENIIYITDSFSINFDLLLYLILIIIILSIAYYFHYKANILKVYTEFNLLIPVFIVIVILGVIFFIYNYTFTNLISKRLHNLKYVIYNNINLEFINKYKICNYIQKKDRFDDYFIYGKCNDLKYSFNQNKLYLYITDCINELYNNNNELSLEQFKTAKDKNGILYKHKLSSAFYTFILARYYIDNNLLEDAKDLFSTYNLLTLLPRINPILSFSYDSLIVNQSNNSLTFELPKMRKAFNNNKDIYNYVYNDYYNISSQIQELIIDIYNICKYKMLSLYDFYLFIGIIIVCIIIYYFVKNYYNKN